MAGGNMALCSQQHSCLELFKLFLLLILLSLCIYFNPVVKLRQARAEKDTSVSSELDCVDPSPEEASTYGSPCSLLQ